MEWIAEHWKIVAAVAIGLGVLVAMVAGINSAIPSHDTLKEWSIQEAIFYGFCVLAFATFVGR